MANIPVNPETGLVYVRDIPQSLFESLSEQVLRDISAYTVAFLRLQTGSERDPAGLLGTGVLVSAHGRRAILTADHVIDELPKAGTYGLLLRKTHQPHSISVEGAPVVRIGRGPDPAVGPDLAAVVLAPHIAGSVAAIKSFYSLDSRREMMLSAPPELLDGLWFAQGFLEERTTVELASDGAGGTKSFYNFSGIGQPEAVERIKQHDYFDFPVSRGSDTPVSWGGMSGGGLWQVRLRQDGDELGYEPPLLSGLLFYQRLTPESECGVRAHGRRSLYDIAYKRLRGDL